MPEKIRHVIGCMTGTSIDALDAALVVIRGEGLAMRCEFVRGVSRPFGDLAGELRLLATQERFAARDIARLALALGEHHAAAVKDVMRGASMPRAELVVLHGQTVFHAPPLSWQMINPWPVVRAAGCPVVFDLRGADLAAGGQGAPITPLSDWLMFRQTSVSTAVVNLGGFCNLTILPRGGRVEDVEGMDVCVCNQLLDAIARERFDAPFDDAGKHALAGSSNAHAEAQLVQHLRESSQARRSLGTGDEHLAWLAEWREKLNGEDLARTATEAIGLVIGDRSRAAGCESVLLAGGGAKNVALENAINRSSGVRTATLLERGVPGEFREAMAMAALGALCQDRVPITLPKVTGVSSPAPIAGCWAYP